MNNIYFHDSVSGIKKEFIPIDKNNIKIYYCGPTVYDYIHIGNLRAFLTADIMVRILKTKYDNVTFVRNITDIDDKIIDRARDNNETVKNLTDRTISYFHDDVESMKFISPDIEPKATDHIEDMILLIDDLLKNNHAYIVEDNNIKSVYFDTSSYKDHGKLSKRDNMDGISHLNDTIKKNPDDFILWKPVKDGEISWKSPWGEGRPGWHTECTVMSRRYLGDKFDIHGGGQDLMFPHHENENAQAVCSGNHDHDMMANYWIHNSMLLIDGKKMSKSEGNFLTIREVLKEIHPEVLKIFLLSTNYRSPLNFTWDGINVTKKHMDYFYKAIQKRNGDFDICKSEGLDFLYNDMNTSGLISYMFSLANESFNNNVEKANELYSIGKFIGIFNEVDWFQNTGIDETYINEQIELRSEYKKNKNWKEADKIRENLKNKGILLEDTKEKTIWRTI